MKRRALSRVAAVLALAWPLGAAAEPLSFCYEDQASYPWLDGRGGGLDIQLIKHVQSALKLELYLHPMPWRRCINMLRQGKMDGAFAASFVPERSQWGLYPMLPDGGPDAGQRLHSASYSLYRLKGTTVDWDGARLSSGMAPIGMQTDFSIGLFLRKQQVEIDDSNRDPLAILQKLRLRRLSGAALQTPRAEQILREHPELTETIERCRLPLEEKPYFLMLSRQLAHREPSLPGRIWAELERQRESPAFLAQLRALGAHRDAGGAAHK
ncbi:transporter substrate-binding domain-containing protein [Chromobacterium sp. Beijing]|uniref:transporter substrate-binding domain-containing protein n=1 Tax=Chromobacterium sp. Beijing TaxID=2735795 RepID=UPI001F2F1C5D|nr:transporter substrate-binding domain-containing protein [Chromobacterium sp. Beijing]UJB30924.1 transporter substrate-binding domain-containing protein [Chromobacterium sp. Beijing]